MKTPVRFYNGRTLYEIVRVVVIDNPTNSRHGCIRIIVNEVTDGWYSDRKDPFITFDTTREGVWLYCSPNVSGAVTHPAQIARIETALAEWQKQQATSE